MNKRQLDLILELLIMLGFRVATDERHNKEDTKGDQLEQLH